MRQECGLQPQAGKGSPPRTLAAIGAELAYNLKAAKGNVVFDVMVLALCFAAFEVNELVVKTAIVSVTESALTALITGHLNDFIGGVAFLAYVNMLLDLVRPDVRIYHFVPCVVFIFLCGLFWEFIAPLFVSGSVSDPLDLLAYVLGGAFYWALSRLFKRNPVDWPASA